MSCIDVISRHVSIRKYTKGSIPKEHVEAIVEAARRAPSSWGLQPLTVIVVEDTGLKEKIAEAVGGQEHVAQAPVFLVFAVDYAKLVEAVRLHGLEAGRVGFGHFAAALLDIGIASGWAALAAEQLGYGITFIAVYAAACKVADILGLPHNVLPVVGLTVGKPAEKPGKLSPRQPVDAFRIVNGYGDAKEMARIMLSDENLKAKYERVLRIVLTPSGFYEKVGEELENCMRIRLG